jgi:hypothetical protein
MTMRNRLSRLEATAAPVEDFRPYHSVIGDTEDECEEQRRAMIKAGKAAKSDKFIFRIILRPPFASLRANVETAKCPV